MKIYEPTDIVTSEDQIRDVIPETFRSQETKILDYIDDLCRLWIERSPFVTMATVDADGKLDVSPKGDPAGFVKVIDPKTLAVPERPGNHRYDSFLNILETGRVGLCFFVPNRNEVVRVNGAATVVRDIGLREAMAIKGRVPDFAVVVRVEEAFYHCGKAIIRSRLWSPEDAVSVDGLPTYATAIKAHSDDTRTLEQLEVRMKYNDEHRLYDE